MAEPEILKDVQDTPEQIAEEENLLKAEPTEVELQSKLKAEVIEKFGLDEDSDSELIAKLVDDKVLQHKQFSKVVRQKRDWRDKAVNAPKEKVSGQPVSDDEIAKKVDERYEENHLKSLGISSELIKEVKALAKLKGISLLEASNDDYIQFKKNESEKENKTNKASIGFSNRGSMAKSNFSEMSPADFDLSTPEGMKGWEEYKKYVRSRP